VRNNYFQPAMRELMAQCVEVWESDPEAFSYHPVGYMQISPESMRADVAQIYEQQQAIGYESHFVEGEAESLGYMKGLFDDWQAKGITSVLHEKKGGYANNTASMYGLAKKAEAQFRCRARGRHRTWHHRMRTGCGRGRALGQRDLEHARAAQDRDHHGARRRAP
jgi:hypothetical protein